MPYTDEELAQLINPPTPVSQPEQAGFFSDPIGSIWKADKQGMNLLPKVGNALFQDSVGAYGALLPGSVSDADIKAAGNVLPTFNVGPNTGVKDYIANDIAPQILTYALPMGEVSGATKAVLGTGRLAGIAAEALGQGVANAFTTAGEGSQGNPLAAGLLGVASGGLQAGLPRLQRALPLAAISGINYAATGDATGSALNFGFNMLPGAFKDVTTPKLVPKDVNTVKSDAGILPTPTYVPQTGEEFSFAPSFSPVENVAPNPEVTSPSSENQPKPIEEPTTQSSTVAQPQQTTSASKPPLSDAINSVISEGDKQSQKKFFISDIYQKLVDSGKYEGTLDQFKNDLHKDISNPDIKYSVTAHDFPVESDLSPEDQQKFKDSTLGYANDRLQKIQGEHPNDVGPKVPTEATKPIEGTPEQIQNIKDAYAKVAAKSDTPDVNIQDVVNASNLFPRVAKGIIADLYNKGIVNRLSAGDWSMANTNKKLGAIVHPNLEGPQLQMSMTAEKANPQVMLPDGTLTELKPRTDGPHIISTVLDEGDGNYLAGKKWNDPHMEGTDSIFGQQIEQATGEGKSGFLIQDAEGNQRVTTDRNEAAQIAESAGQRNPEDIGRGGLQSQQLVDPIQATQAPKIIANEASQTYNDLAAIRGNLEKALADAKNRGDRAATRIAARKLSEFIENTNPQEFEQSQEKIKQQYGKVETPAERSTGGKVSKSDISSQLNVEGGAKGIEGDESIDKLSKFSIEDAPTRMKRMGRKVGGQAGQISPEMLTALALGGVGGAIGYAYSKGDVGATIAMALAGVGLGLGGAKAFQHMRDIHGPEGEVLKTKFDKATTKEKLDQFATNTLKTPGGFAVAGRGGIWATAVRQAEMLGMLGRKEDLVDAKIRGGGFVSDQINQIQKTVDQVKGLKPSTGFLDAALKMFRGTLVDNATMESLIRGGGGFSSEDFAKLPAQAKAAYPEKWMVLDDPNSTNTKGDGVTIYRVSNAAKAKLVQMQEAALSRLATTPADQEFLALAKQMRNSADAMQQVIHTAAGEGPAANKIIGTTGQYASRAFNIITNPKYYPTETNIQNAMDRVASLREGRFLEQYGSPTAASPGSIPISYNGQTHYIDPKMQSSWENLHTPEQLRSIVTQRLKDLKSTRALVDAGMMTAEEAQLGGSLFSGRKELDEVTRALLGEHEAPLEIMQDTINKLAPQARAAYSMLEFAKLPDEKTGLSGVFRDSIEYNKQINALRQEIKNPSLSPVERQKVQTKYQELSSYIPISGQDPRMGLYQGSYVSRAVHDQIKGYEGPFGMLDTAVGKGMGAFNRFVKQTHTIYNPIVYVRNLFQAPMFMAMGGATSDVGAWKTAMEALKDPTSLVGRRATLNGVFEGNALHGELADSIEKILSGEAEQGLWGKVKGGHDAMLKFYAGMDNFIRASSYFAAENRAAKKFGVSVDSMDPRVMDEARNFMSRRTMDYGNVANIVKFGRKIPLVSMYLSYTSEIARITKNMAVDALHGDLGAAGTLGGLASMPFLLQQMGINGLSTKDKGDWVRGQNVVQDYSRPRFKIPLSRNKDGSFNYLDVTNLFPHNDFEMMARSAFKGDWRAALATNPYVSMDNTPLLNTAVSMITGKNEHTERPFRGVGDYATQIAQDILPPHTPGVGTEYLKDAPPALGGQLGVTNLKNGRTSTIEGALTRHLLGVDMTQINSDIALKNFVADAKSDIANERQYYIDVAASNAPADTKQRALQRYVGAIHTITNRMQTRINLVNSNK